MISLLKNTLVLYDNVFQNNFSEVNELCLYSCISYEKFKESEKLKFGGYYNLVLFFYQSRDLDIKEIVDFDILSKIYDYLKPGGSLQIYYVTEKDIQETDKNQLDDDGLCSGFVNIQINKETSFIKLSFQRPLWDSIEIKDEKCDTKPKACANCSCGRKELELQFGPEEAKRRLENSLVESKCGNCYKGDEYRCDLCPYKGLPAFKPGEKIELSLKDQEL